MGRLHKWVCCGVAFLMQANRDVVIAAISDNGLALIHAGEDALPLVLKWAHINIKHVETKLYRLTFYLRSRLIY
jgi:hypothetical protein